MHPRSGVAIMGVGLAVLLACDKPKQAPESSHPRELSDSAKPTDASEPTDSSEPTNPSEPNEATTTAATSPATPVAEPDAVVVTGIMEALAFDAAGVCRASVRVGEEAPTLMLGEPWMCEQETRDEGKFFVGQLVTTSVGPCGKDPRCTSPDAIVLTEPHIRGRLAAFLTDATGACFVGLHTADGMVYFPASDELCWAEDDYWKDVVYETALGPCGPSLGCRYWKIDFIVAQLYRPPES